MARKTINYDALNNKAISQFIVKVQAAYSKALRDKMSGLVTAVDRRVNKFVGSEGNPSTAGWVQRTGNLRAGIGVGVYDPFGTLVARSGEVQVKSSSAARYRNRDGKTLLNQALKSVGTFRDAKGRFTKGRTGNYFTVQVFVAVPYGWILSSQSGKAYSGWIKKLMLIAGNEINTYWNLYMKTDLKKVKVLSSTLNLPKN